MTNLPDLEAVSESAVVVDALHRLVVKARRGKHAAAVEMAKLLQETPSIWKFHVAEACQLEQGWGTLVAAKNPSAIESCRQEAQEFCNWRQGQDSSVLTELLARRQLVNTLALRFAEFAVGDSLGSKAAAFLQNVQRQFRQLTKRSIFDVTELQRLMPRLTHRSRKCPGAVLPDALLRERYPTFSTRKRETRKRG